jgi:archaellum component FlaC
MTTKSGRTFTPLSDYDVLNEIYEDMGEDVHDYVANRVLELNEESEYERLKFNSDFRSLEQSNENWHQFVQDISDEIEALREKIETTGITKAKISVELWNIYEKMRLEL